jgi:hypothetical protein
MIAHAAVSANPSTLIQVLTPLATIVAAILAALITGFGAAALKHKWDSEADETRWRREHTARERVQRLDAFAQYLAARPDLATAKSIAGRSADPAIVVSAARLAATRLLILLPNGDQRAVVEGDLQNMVDWVSSWAAPSTAGRKDVPSTQPILSLARELVVGPDERTADH